MNPVFRLLDKRLQQIVEERNIPFTPQPTFDLVINHFIMAFELTNLSKDVAAANLVNHPLLIDYCYLLSLKQLCELSVQVKELMLESKQDEEKLELLNEIHKAQDIEVYCLQEAIRINKSQGFQETLDKMKTDILNSTNRKYERQ